MKIFAAIFLWLLAMTTVFATAQQSEPLQIGDTIHHIYGSVLSESMITHYRAYFAQHGPGNQSTSNYKGYAITLAVVESQLIIRDIDFGDTYPRAKTEDIIGLAIPGTGLPADWFSGELIEYFGERFLAHTMTDERVFVFEQGILKKIFERKNRFWEELSRREKSRS